MARGGGEQRSERPDHDGLIDMGRSMEFEQSLIFVVDGTIQATKGVSGWFPSGVYLDPRGH